MAVVAARLERVAFMRARERAERDRRVGRAVGRRADLGDGNAKRVGGDGVAVDVRELALIGAEAERSITLDVLDRAIVLAHGEMDVGGRDVVLEIDEGLLAVPLGLSVGNTEDAPGSGEFSGSPVWMSIPAKVSFLSNVASSAAIVWCVSASACSRRNSPVTAPTQ